MGEYEVTLELKEQRIRKEEKKVHPVEAQTETQNRRMVLKHGGAPLVAERNVDLTQNTARRHKRGG